LKCPDLASEIVAATGASIAIALRIGALESEPRTEADLDPAIGDDIGYAAFDRRLGRRTASARASSFAASRNSGEKQEESQSGLQDDSRISSN
jgi:hypothetical protein